MSANLDSVNGVTARIAVPSFAKIDAVAPSAPAPGGNNVATSGQSLPPVPPPSVVDVERAVQKLSELASGKERSLQFQVDESSGRTVITVINAATNEVVRQIPSEELLAILRNLDQLGSLMDTWT